MDGRSKKYMKKTIGVVTIFDSSGNIGNKLQNYAVINIYTHMGFDARTLATEKYPSVLFLFKLNIKEIIRGVVKGNKRFNPYKISRIIRFRKFDKHLNVDFSMLNLKKINYDYYSVGSDQVWNPNFYKYDLRRKDYYFLTFAENLKKISFSPSFSVENIPKDWEEWFKTNLKDFKALSVREDAGAKIIKGLTGRDATVLVDPTMLLTVDEWRKVSKKPKGAKEGYVLTYFLSPKCNEAAKQLEEIRDEREVYELLNPDDKVAGKAGPSEFLWLFDHTDIILTDSFHACVFSFLFNKPFIVYDRNWDEGNMNSRLETLLSKFHLERKYVGSGVKKDIWEHDYEEGYKQLELERKKAMDFLKKALED